MPAYSCDQLLLSLQSKPVATRTKYTTSTPSYAGEDAVLTNTVADVCATVNKTQRDVK